MRVVWVNVRVLGKESESEYLMHLLLLVGQKEWVRVSDGERRERKRNNT